MWNALPRDLIRVVASFSPVPNAFPCVARGLVCRNVYTAGIMDRACSAAIPQLLEDLRQLQVRLHLIYGRAHAHYMKRMDDWLWAGKNYAINRTRARWLQTWCQDFGAYLPREWFRERCMLHTVSACAGHFFSHNGSKKCRRINRGS